MLGIITAALGSIMCFAEHNLKRLLAFSTMCHSGLMLIAVGALEAGAMGGYLLYVIGHGLVKGGLFASAGIVLHRLRYIGEHKLHGLGRGMVGDLHPIFCGSGRAGCNTWVSAGERRSPAVTEAARNFHLGWVAWIFFFGGISTAAAVLRFALRTFLGWGETPRRKTAPPRSVKSRRRMSNTKAFLRAGDRLGHACCCWQLRSPSFREVREIADSSARLFTDQAAYQSMVIDAPRSSRLPLTRLPPSMLDECAEPSLPA